MYEMRAIAIDNLVVQKSVSLSASRSLSGWRLLGEYSPDGAAVRLLLQCCSHLFKHRHHLAMSEITLSWSRQLFSEQNVYGFESCPLAESQLDYVVNRFLWNYLEHAISRLSVNVAVSLRFTYSMLCCHVVLRISREKSLKMTTLC